MRLIVGITGATGVVFGVRILEQLRAMPQAEKHLVISRWARATMELETGRSAAEVAELADVTYAPGDQDPVLDENLGWYTFRVRRRPDQPGRGRHHQGTSPIGVGSSTDAAK